LAVHIVRVGPAHVPAGWSTYGFERGCYTGEFKNPKSDTFKAIFYSDLLCIAAYTLVPFAFRLPRLVNWSSRPNWMRRPVVSRPCTGMLHRTSTAARVGRDGADGPGGRIGGAIVVVMLILATCCRS